jgi:hypothetical protein
MAVVLIPFAGPFGRLGLKVWGRFGEVSLRLMGAASVLFGGALIHYGLLWG